MNKILITGGNGFLGKATKDFLSKNYTIKPIDYYKVNPSTPDCLLHFSWIGASNSKDLNNPAQIDNIPNAIKLFNEGLQLGIKYFVFISTSWIYGDYKNICYEENICEPKNLYGFSKLKVEEIWVELAKIHGCKLKIVRPFWIFGPGDKENRFIPQIIKKCLNNEKIELHPAENEVDYLFVSDLTSAIYTILQQKNDNVFERYNICSGVGYKIKDVVEGIKSLTNSKSKIIYNLPYKIDFNKKWVGSFDNLQKLGWYPKVSLEEGLKETIEYYKNQ